jgi:type IV secretion system pilin
MKYNMFRNIRNRLVAVLSVAALLVPVAVPALASAATGDIRNNLCGGTTLSVDSGGDCNTDTTSSTSQVQNIVTKGVNLFSIVVGIVAVIMIVVGGFRYITSGGDSGKITSAKTTIIYALIGLVIVALAQFIVQFVLNKATQS